MTQMMAQMVKNPPAMQETWVQSLGWEDPLETGKATHSSILAQGLYSPWGRTESDMTEQLSTCKHKLETDSQTQRTDLWLSRSGEFEW